MIRDEIAKALAASNSWMLAHECRDSADALMPIVERVARACIDEVHRADLIRRNPVYKGPEPLSDDAIVRRVMEGGQ